MSLRYGTALAIVMSIARTLLAPSVAQAVPGDLDTSFGTGGLVETDVSPGAEDEINAIARQYDGKIVAAGGTVVTMPAKNKQIALARYLVNGALDTTFGTNGIVTLDLPGNNETLEAVAVQGDGKIIASGTDTYGPLVLVRYTSTGTLDASFGNGGIVSNSQMWEGAGLVIQPDGKIVVTGAPTTCCGAAFARYLDDGTLDPSFGSGGVAIVMPAAGPSIWPYGLLIQPDGKLVAGGTQYQGPKDWDFVVVRVNDDGTPDSTFGSGGFVTTDFNLGIDGIRSVALQHDGKIVAAGSTRHGDGTQQADDSDFALARYNVDGTLDTSFGANGLVTTNFGSPLDGANAVVIQTNQKIIAVGTALPDFALARYKTDGTLDPTFAYTGMVTTNFGLGLWDQANAALLQPNGRLVAAGMAFQWNTFGLARYQTTGYIALPGGPIIKFPYLYDPNWWLKWNPAAAVIVGNIFYVPAKLGFAAVGAVTGGIAYAATLGRGDAARSVWQASLGGDYLVTPTKVANHVAPRFVGGTGAPVRTAPPPVVMMQPPERPTPTAPAQPPPRTKRAARRAHHR